MIALLAFLLLGAPAWGGNQRGSSPKLCNEVVTTMFPEWSSRTSRRNLGRVEIRNCRIGGWGFLQIAAWSNNSSDPSLVVDTKRSTIVKAGMDGNVFVLETAGASSNVIQVVLYGNGIPRLALQEVMKGYADVRMGWKKVVVRLPREKAPDQVYEFPTGIN